MSENWTHLSGKKYMSLLFNICYQRLIGFYSVCCRMCIFILIFSIVILLWKDVNWNFSKAYLCILFSPSVVTCLVIYMNGIHIIFEVDKEQYSHFIFLYNIILALLFCTIWWHGAWQFCCAWRELLCSIILQFLGKWVMGRLGKKKTERLGKNRVSPHFFPFFQSCLEKNEKKTLVFFPIFPVFFPGLPI